MIRKVHFQNFRCLRDVELTLEPLTVLVGPNSSGKTTALKGLTPLQLSVSEAWQRDESLWISIVCTYDDRRPWERHSNKPPSPPNLELLAPVAQQTGVTRAEAMRVFLRESPQPHKAQSLALDLDALRSENVLALATELNETGSNLTNVFTTLPRRQQEAVAQELCRLVPMFSDVDSRPTSNGKHQLLFQDRWKSELWFTPDQVSDGTLLLLAFIVLQYQNPVPDLITIEEPERALHPYLLDELLQMLRKMSTGEMGRKPVQVVLATHSAELLEYVRPEEVRFLTRSREDGSVQVNQAATDTPNWRRVYEEYNRSLGGIWLSGGMGGVPGA